jgi:hypothetical protein
MKRVLRIFLYVFFTHPVTDSHYAFVKDFALPDDQAREEAMLGLRLGISGQFSTVD